MANVVSANHMVLKHMKRFFLILFVIPFTVGISAQESATVISADRPGMATGVDVMPFKSVQWETGFQYDYSSGAHSITLPTTLFRFGITRFAELRVEYDGSLASGDGKRWEYAVEPLVLGTKIKFFEGTENEKLQWLPAVSFLFNLAIPSTPDLAKTTHVAPSAYLLFHHEATDWLSIDYNVGAEWDGVSARPATFLALCLGFGITDKAGSFLESYNYITDYGKNTAGSANLDFGFTYLVHPRVQLDVYGAFNCQDPASSANVGLGVAWMIK